MPGILATQLPGYATITRGLLLTIHMHRPGTLPQFVVTETTPTDANLNQEEMGEKKQHRTLVDQQNFGVQPNDLIRWFHACM